jgi:hypothetical protein
MQINIPAPGLQIDFSFALAQIRSFYLGDALRDTVEELEIPEIDRELAEMVPPVSLNAFSRQGLRGELVFAVPRVLRANPRLLGYYRFLLGFSQKDFYNRAFGVSPFKAMETRGVLRRQVAPHVEELCRSLITSACALIDGIGIDRLSRELLNDLMLLTVGAQLRGGANVRIGLAATARVFELIHEIVRPAILTAETGRIEIRNAAGRKVLIEFAADPDIVIREEMAANTYREHIAIEVKGGTDFSNVHNRIGEAEKSHQTARGRGYYERWTIVNVDRIDLDKAYRESPSTSRFYIMSQLLLRDGEAYSDFRYRIISSTGITDPGTKE